MTAEQLAEIEFPTMLRICYNEVAGQLEQKDIHIGHVMARFVNIYRDEWYKAHGINRKKLTKTSKKFNNLADMVIDFTENMEMNHGVTWAKYHGNVYMNDDDLFNFLVEII